MTLFLERPELLQTFREGQPIALAEVYRSYRPRVDAYLESLSKRGFANAWRAFAVPDLRQEVFLRAFSPRTRAAYDPNRRYAPYLIKIAHHCFLDEARLRQREALLVDDTVVSASNEPHVHASDAQDAQLEAIVERYLAGLPERLRAVYDQRFVFDESQEVARLALGLSRRQLRTAEAHLKLGLRKALVRHSLTPSHVVQSRFVARSPG
jgi:RNA polymerase sigma-70 factor (ECF subfamily)